MRFRNVIGLLALTIPVITVAGPPAKVADLAWMAGTWATPLGGNTLEENWTKPRNGSMGSLVRMTGPAGVSMWEVITVEEKDGSLVLSIQQWSKGFESRTPVAQKMELEEISANRVKFKAVTEGSMQSLQYSLSADNVFSIEMVVPGGVNRANLKAVQ